MKWQADRPSWLAGGGRNACLTKNKMVASAFPANRQPRGQVKPEAEREREREDEGTIDTRRALTSYVAIEARKV